MVQSLSSLEAADFRKSKVELLRSQIDIYLLARDVEMHPDRAFLKVVQTTQKQIG